ncbi:MAG: hypothetical protein QMD07_02325 [Thermodesulfovibrionales bacterium]|nr:hypothetical protein [Thermodesulfovibrionales bacterium]
MTYDKLIESLYNEGEDKIRLVREETAADREQIKREASEKMRCIFEEHSRALSALIKEKADAIISDARNRAGDIKLASEHRLSERLYGLASNSLGLLRNEDYSGIFERIAGELPGIRWQRVRVNPKDRETAKKYFPDAEIEADAAITGGIDADAEDGKICAVNTFEKRLERGWQDILPEIIRDTYKS